MVLVWGKRLPLVSTLFVSGLLATACAVENSIPGNDSQKLGGAAKGAPSSLANEAPTGTLEAKPIDDKVKEPPKLEPSGGANQAAQVATPSAGGSTSTSGAAMSSGAAVSANPVSANPVSAR